jgi:hypothetical protein
VADECRGHSELNRGVRLLFLSFITVNKRLNPPHRWRAIHIATPISEAKMQVHAVPDSERAFDSTGRRLPWGYEFAE